MSERPEQATERSMRHLAYIRELQAELEKARDKIAEMGNRLIDCTEERDEVKADSQRLDKVFQTCEIRYWYAAHPDCFETIETREAIDKLEEEDR